MDTVNLAKDLVRVIDETEFANRYDSESAFERYIYATLKSYLGKRLGVTGKDLDEMIITHGNTEELWTKSKQKQDVIIAGSSNTADVFITLSDNETIAVQLKYVKHKISSAIQTIIGQSFIFSLKHSAVIGIVFSEYKKQLKDNKAKGGDKLESIRCELEKRNIFLLVKFI